MSYRGDLRAAVRIRLEGNSRRHDRELKTALRSVLNEATGYGQRNWESTVEATLAAVQGLVNRVGAVETSLRAVAAAVIDLQTAGPTTCELYAGAHGRCRRPGPGRLVH